MVTLAAADEPLTEPSKFNLKELGGGDSHATNTKSVRRGKGNGGRGLMEVKGETNIQSLKAKNVLCKTL